MPSDHDNNAPAASLRKAFVAAQQTKPSVEWAKLTNKLEAFNNALPEKLEAAVKAAAKGKRPVIQVDFKFKHVDPQHCTPEYLAAQPALRRLLDYCAAPEHDIAVDLGFYGRSSVLFMGMPLPGSHFYLRLHPEKPFSEGMLRTSESHSPSVEKPTAEIRAAAAGEKPATTGAEKPAAPGAEAPPPHGLAL